MGTTENISKMYGTIQSLKDEIENLKTKNRYLSESYNDLKLGTKTDSQLKKENELLKDRIDYAVDCLEKYSDGCDLSGIIDYLKEKL